jgi:hypothetical protein
MLPEGGRGHTYEGGVAYVDEPLAGLVDGLRLGGEFF